MERFRIRKKKGEKKGYDQRVNKLPSVPLAKLEEQGWRKKKKRPESPCLGRLSKKIRPEGVGGKKENLSPRTARGTGETLPSKALI